MTGRRLTVDDGRCAGHGLCYGSFPELFTEDPYGHAEPYPEPLSQVETADAQRAAANCPEGAIHVEGGEA